MSLQWLKYLVALADHGHFGRAAEVCFITQSTLSTQIKKPEDFRGVTRFDRSLKRVTPTPIDREILAAARSIVEEAERITRAGPDGAHEPPRCHPHPGPVLPAARADAGAQEASRPAPVAARGDDFADPRAPADGRLDAGLLALPVADETLRVEPLFYEPFYAALPARHPLAKCEVLKVADIINEKLLLLDEGHCLRDQALDVCGAGSAGREEVRATSLETLRQMVAIGLGLTRLPALAVDAAPRVSKKAVEIRPFKSPPPGRTIGLAWRRRARPETFERLAVTLKASLPARVEPV